MASVNSRFGTLNLSEINQREEELKNINSLKNEKKATEALKAYLETQNVQNTDFFMYTEDELDEHLATFWWNARTKKGEKCKAGSLDT